LKKVVGEQEFAIPATMKVVDADHWFREKGHTSGSAMPASTDTTPLVSVAMRPFLMMS